MYYYFDKKLFTQNGKRSRLLHHTVSLYPKEKFLSTMTIIRATEQTGLTQLPNQHQD
jgi:hypothetical protein